MAKKYGAKFGMGGKPGKKAPKKPKADPFKTYNPLAMRTGKEAKRYINASTRLEFNPLARQLKSEAQASRFRESQEIPAYFQAYQNDVAKLRGETQGAYDAALGRTEALSAQAGTQDASNRAAVMDRLSRDAALRGTSVDPNLDVGQADAEAARANVRASTHGTIAGQGANAFSSSATRQGIGGLQSIEQRMAEAARGRKIAADQRELEKSKGDYRSKMLNELTESDRKYDLELKSLRSDKQIAKMSQKGQNKRNAADNATSIANAIRTQKGQNKRQEDDQRFDKKQAKKAEKGRNKRAKIGAKK